AAFPASGVLELEQVAADRAKRELHGRFPPGFGLQDLCREHRAATAARSSGPDCRVDGHGTFAFRGGAPTMSPYMCDSLPRLFYAEDLALMIGLALVIGRSIVPLVVASIFVAYGVLALAELFGRAPGLGATP
ncbi:hypothetical protein, partial [Sphingomonas sp.]|uniref:hypothetical protein n=1 Tax=Sphingomonas sp. TaxID=28214 RepID=UPI002DD66894